MAPAIKILLFTVLVWSTSCKTTLVIPSESGYQVEVTDQQSQILQGELITVDETTMILAIDQELHLMQHQSIDQLRIPDLRAPGKTPVMWGVAAASVGIAVAILASGDEPAVSAIGFASGLGAWAASRSPREKYYSPFSPKHLQRLKNYCRYPQGLDSTQLEQLLAAYQQQELIRY